MTELEARKLCLQWAHEYVVSRNVGRIEVLFKEYMNLLTDNGRIVLPFVEGNFIPKCPNASFPKEDNNG